MSGATSDDVIRCVCVRPGNLVLGVQRQDVNGEWGTVLRDVGSFYIIVTNDAGNLVLPGCLPISNGYIHLLPSHNPIQPMDIHKL